MSKIKFTDIPRHFKGLPHQIASLQFLQDNTPDSVQEEFAEIWRSAVYDKVQDVANSWAGIALAAKEAGAKYPELVAAQWALESGWGKQLTGTYNVFGQKGSPGTLLTPSEGGPPVEFLNFPSFRASVQYLVDRWHKDFKQYKGVNHAPNREVAAQMLMAEGYVGIPPQNPQYANTLIRLMRENAPISSSYGNPLAVPWFAQLDSATDQGRRMCFSSSCAMLVAYLKPGVLIGPNGDDQYLQRVMQYGDTTDAAAHLQALKSYGIRATFTKQADFKVIEQQIDRGVPVPCGYKHRGHVSQPSGAGHWLTVVGYTGTHLVVHDPLNEADLVNGTTLNATARFARYSRQNFAPRWMVEGPGNGWAILAER